MATWLGLSLPPVRFPPPGLEYYLNLPSEQIPATEAAVVGLVDDLKYANLLNRGYMTLTFSSEEVVSEWFYVDSILSKDFTEAEGRRAIARSLDGKPGILLG